MSTNTGGAAFPMPTAVNPMSGEMFWGEGGMTLRDYFAAKAMQGLMTAQNENGTWQFGDAGDVAQTAYRIADAMLAARGAA